MHTHFQFTVKYRKRPITSVISLELKKTFFETSEKLDIRLVAFGSANDHTHCVIGHPSTMLVGAIAGRLKGASSRHVRLIFPELIEIHNKHFWSPTYHSKNCDHYLENAAAYAASHPFSGQRWK
jgi:REP element-mobilizing transposase RayT